MPTNFSLYGPTPSAAAAQQMPWSNFYLDQNNLNERARAAAVLQSIQLQEAQDRQDEAARRYDQERQFNFAQLNQNAAERAARLDDTRALRGEEMRRFGIELGMKREADVEGKRRFEDEMKYKREALIARPDAVAARTTENEIKRLQAMADLGELNDERHVLSLSPMTSAPMAKQLATTSAIVRRDAEAKDAQVKAAIDTVKQFEKLQYDLKQAGKVHENLLGDWARGRGETPNADRKANIEALQKELAKIAPAYQQVINPKNPLYEDVQLYRNTGVPPRAWQRAQTSTAAPVNFQNFSTATEVAPAPVVRPAITNQDGTVSTVSSIGVGDDRGEWVIPTIVDGRRLSNDEATQLWRAGRNAPLGGPFRTVEESNRFAQQFHNQEAQRLGLAPPDADVAEAKYRALQKVADQYTTGRLSLNPWHFDSMRSAVAEARKAGTEADRIRSENFQRRLAGNDGSVSAPPPMKTTPLSNNIFSSEAEARTAGRQDGDIIIINGRRAQLVPD